MSCEIIQFSAAAERPGRSVSGKQATAGVTAIGNRALYAKAAAARRKAGASTAGDRNRQECRDPNRTSRCMVACRAGGRLLARAIY
jgi:hypothetical protein